MNYSLVQWHALIWLVLYVRFIYSTKKTCCLKWQQFHTMEISMIMMCFRTFHSVLRKRKIQSTVQIQAASYEFAMDLSQHQHFSMNPFFQNHWNHYSKPKHWLWISSCKQTHECPKCVHKCLKLSYIFKTVCT